MAECRNCIQDYGLCGDCYEGSLYKGINNANRIRNMSDEELVEVVPCPYIKDDYDECRFGWHEPEMTCEQCKLEWLKSEAKE